MIIVIAHSDTDTSVFPYGPFDSNELAEAWIDTRIDRVRFTYTITTLRTPDGEPAPDVPDWVKNAEPNQNPSSPLYIP